MNQKELYEVKEQSEESDAPMERGHVDWKEIPGPGSLHFRIYPDGEVHIMGKIKDIASIDRTVQNLGRALKAEYELQKIRTSARSESKANTSKRRDINQFDLFEDPGTKHISDKLKTIQVLGLQSQKTLQNKPGAGSRKEKAG